MKRGRSGLLFFTASGMELSWYYAWAAYLTAAIFQRSFPLPEAIVTFALAACLTLVSRGRGWRVIWVAAVQVAGFAAAALRTLYTFQYRSQPFLEREWLMELLRGPKVSSEWFMLATVLFIILSVWVGGVIMARRPASYLALCSRFDLGLGAFLLLLLIRLVLRVKGGIEPVDIGMEFMLLTFFVFGLMSIGLARSRSDAVRVYLLRYRHMGVILTFVAVVILFGSGLVFLFLPYLTSAAETGYGIMRGAVRPFVPILIRILRFLLVSNRGGPAEPTGSSGGNYEVSGGAGEVPWWMEMFEKVFGWGIFGMTVLVVAVFLGLGLWILLRWLLSRTPAGEKVEKRPGLIPFVIAELLALFRLFREMVFGGLRGPIRAAKLYVRLLGWGRHSGLSHFPTETSREYGVRLENRFPALREEIGTIVEAFNREVYGEEALDQESLSGAGLAWRRLRSPFLWPSRLKSWFFQTEEAIAPHGWQSRPRY